MWNGFVWLRIRMHLEGDEFLDQPSDCQFLTALMIVGGFNSLCNYHQSGGYILEHSTV